MAEDRKREAKKRTNLTCERETSVFEQIANRIDSHAAAITALATIVLALLTYFYMREARGQRRAAQRSITLMEKSIDFETSPKPYIKDIETIWQVSKSKENTLEGKTSIKLANCGRIEATNIKLHKVLSKGTLKDDTTISAMEYLYPGQEPILTIGGLEISCSPEVILALKEGKGLTIPKERQEPISLTIDLTFDDDNGNVHPVPYKFEYNYRLHKWVPAGFGMD